MLFVRDLKIDSLAALLRVYGLSVVQVEESAEIRGSFWGESEAGLIGARLFLRSDTPVHSVLHEAAHFVCMDKARRQALERDAGGDHAEENAVCYLQILLADGLPPMTRERMQTDMDAWGYTFRLGSARAWFEQDAEEAREWLMREAIIDCNSRPTGRLRA